MSLAPIATAPNGTPTTTGATPPSLGGTPGVPGGTPGGTPAIALTPPTPPRVTTRSRGAGTQPQVQQPQAPQPQAQQLQGTQQYTPVLYTAATPPAPVGHIATEIHKVSTIEQRKNAEDLFTLLSQPQPQLIHLNNKKWQVAALLGVPETSKVKMVYGLGFGTTPVGTPAPLTDKLLALTGEAGPDIGLPDVIALDSKALTTKTECLVPTDAAVQTELTANPQFGEFLLNPLNVTTKAQILRGAVIPAFYCYDGLHNDICAAELYERLLLITDPTPMVHHALDFLRAMVVGKLRRSDEKPWVSPDEWRKVVPVEAKMWKKTRSEELFPALFQTQAPIPAGLPPPGNSQFTPEFFLQMFQLMQAQTAQKPAQTVSTAIVEEKKEESGGGMKISDLESRIMKRMCGYNPDSDDSVFPTWFKQLMAKHQTDNDKDMIVANALTKQGRFEDHKITVHPELRATVRKRTWTGNEAGAVPQYPQACYGITPFAMLDLTQDEVAILEYDHQIEASATTLTVNDLKGTKKKLKATVPENGYKWLSVIFQFTNYLQNLFGSCGEMYTRMLDLSKAIRDYDINIILNLPLAAKAAVLWIIHLQARHYAHGRMHIEYQGGALLPCFKHMYNMVLAGQLHLVSIASLPGQLLKSPTAGKPPGGNRGGGGGDPGTKNGNGKRVFAGEEISEERLAKLLKLEEREKTRTTPGKVREQWNQALKDKLAEPLKIAKYPSLHRICQYCKLTSQDTLAPGIDRKTCRNFLVLGKCRWGNNCTMNHKTATEEQATTILAKLEEFIAKPDGIPPGKHN